MTTTTTTVPLPPGALYADDWETQPDGSETRAFEGLLRGQRVQIEIRGIQARSGEVLQRVAVADTELCGGVELDAAGLRELAADALGAADELDRLA